MDYDKVFNYPRPQLRRDSFVNLNGKWDFAFDQDNKGESLGFIKGFKKQKDIIVPFPYETQISGIGIVDLYENVWYQKIINLQKKEHKRYILHLEGSDYITKVYVNSEFVGEGKGAYHRLSFDITDHTKDGDNLIVIKCEDSYSKNQPRGKQRTRNENYECFYVDFVGIYKTVWLEEVNEIYLQKLRITPHLDERTVELKYLISENDNTQIDISILFDNQEVSHFHKQIQNKEEVATCLLDEIKPWSVKEPNLYDVVITLLDNNNQILDKVNSYFGLRKIEAKDSFIYLNNEKLYLKLVLDQGYWQGSSSTPKDVEALKKDLLLMKEFGFNGCRKHEKTEDERFLFLADYFGYLVWEEIPSFFQFNDESKDNYRYELPLILEDNYNHPSIITWTLFNESWGIDSILDDKNVQAFVDEMYYLTKEFDKTRFVITNDGWEHTLSDIITFHHYAQEGEKLYSYYVDKNIALTEIWKDHWKGAFAHGYEYKGQPIIFSEFGGTAFSKDTFNVNWGYGSGVANTKEFIDRVDLLFKALQDIPYLSGYCYTQASDVEQEVTGLLDRDHNPKIDPKLLKAIQDRRE